MISSQSIRSSSTTTGSRFVALLLLFAFTWLATGCGSSSQDFVNTNTGSFVLTPETVQGKLFLGATVGGVPVQLQTVDGLVLGATVTDGAGSFTFPGPVPTNFRVVATLSDGLAFSREIRDFQGDQFVVVNVPTTLISLLVQGNPGLSLPEVEATVRDRLGLPVNSDLGLLEDSPSFAFSHLAFFVRAAAAGDVRTHLQELASSGGRYVLRKEVLDGSLGQLAPELAERLEAVRSNPRVQLAAQMWLARGFEQPSGSLSIAGVNPQFGEGVAGVAAALLASVAAGLGTNVISDGIGAGYTWIAEQLGWHYGTTVEMDEILESIQQVAAGVTAITNTLTQDEIQAGVTAMNAAVTAIVGDTNDQISAYYAAKDQANYFNDQPTSTTTLPEDVSDYLTTVQTDQTIEDYKGYLTLIAQWMTGASNLPVGNNPPVVVEAGYSANMNMIGLSRKAALEEQCGINIESGTEVYMDFPVRTSALLDQTLQPWQNYAIYQILAANQLGEASHASSTPASEIISSQVAIDNVARSLQSQRGQVPGYPLSDHIFIDLQYGLMWYMPLQDSTSYSNANDRADSFSLTLSDGHTYSDWRLPSFNEAKALQQRGVYAAAAGNSAVDYGNTVSGLAILGFDTSGINSDGDIWSANWVYGGGGLFGDDSWSLSSDTLETRLNHETDDYAYNQSSNRPYYLVRSINNPLIKIDNPSTIAGPESTWPSSFTSTLQPWEEPWMATFESFSNISATGGVVTWTSNWKFYIGNSTSFTLGDTTVSGTGFVDRTGSSGPYTNTTLHPPVYFTQDDSTRVSVSNYEGSFAQITPHINANQSTTITLHALGYANNTSPTNIKGTVASPTSSPQLSLTSIQVAQRNVVISVEGGDAQQQFVATGFFSDGSVQDLTEEVTWTVTGASSGASFAAADAGLLKLTQADLLGLGVASVTLTVQADIDVTSGNPTKVGTDQTAVLVDIN